MYLHIGQDCVVADGEILGIFDLDTTSISKHTRDFLAQAEKKKRVVNVTDDLPKSFLVTEKAGRVKVYISQIAPATLKKRSSSLPNG